MKRLTTYIAFLLLLLLVACNDEQGVLNVTLYDIDIQLVASEEVDLNEIKVSMTDGNQTIYSQLTDAEGCAHFSVPAGFYTASVSFRYASDGEVCIMNGLNSSIELTTQQADSQASINVSVSTVNQIVIKEFYHGGCPMDDGSGIFYYDAYALLYNNSSEVATVKNMCMSTPLPYNANASNYNYSDGELVYASEDWVPCAQMLWYMADEISIEPYSQISIAFKNALNCAETYSNSVDLSNVDYVTYDNTVCTHTRQHPTPSSLIPTSHYFKCLLISQGTGWALSVVSPAFCVFATGDVDPRDIVDDPDNEYYAGSLTLPNRCIKMKRKYTIDAIEIYNTQYASNKKRLTPDMDAGYILETTKLGHSLYRNVDLEETLAIDGNEELLVYGYELDPNNIDAEASIANGAKIVYQDTNNTSVDFHERLVCSLKK